MNRKRIKMDLDAVSEPTEVSEEASVAVASAPPRVAVFTWFDPIASVLMGLSIVAGLSVWSTVFETPDRILCFGLIAAGLFVGLARSRWRGELSKRRTQIAWTLLGLAAISVASALLFSNPSLGVISGGLTLASWCSVRMLGERVTQALLLGLMLWTPFLVQQKVADGSFAWLESATVATTSILADAGSQAHAREENTVLFGRGIADQFAVIGRWDGVLIPIGFALFCILAFRRNLVSGSILLALSVLVWVAVRSSAWVLLSYFANRNETWYEWTWNLELSLLLFSIVMVLCLDRWFAIVFAPVPFALFNPESPLSSYLWNWLCDLPSPVLRIPKDNKIYKRWRQRLMLAKKTPSTRTDYDWLKLEFLDLLFKPIAAIGSLIDLVRGWRYSRHWIGFWICTPAVVLLAAIYVAFGFSMSSRNDGALRLYSQESEILCTTELLEENCFQKQEEKFVNAMRNAAVDKSQQKPEPVPSATLRYVELLCKRILSIEPNNSDAKYRLGMIYCLSDQGERASLEMKSVSENRFVEFPKADAWLSKDLVIRLAAGENESLDDLLHHLSQAAKGKDVDFRLLFAYSRFLEERGDFTKAVEVSKKAVAARPEYVLELARLNARIGDSGGLMVAANQAEDYFNARINIASETVNDLLALSEAQIHSNRLEQAEMVLLEGLPKHEDSPLLRRQLSEVQRLMYVKTIRQPPVGKVEVDLVLLEKAADSDVSNPNVSIEIAKLLPFKIRPTKKILDALKKQIELGVVGVPSLLMLGDGYFAVGNLNEAKLYWEMAYKKEPNNINALNNLAYCLASLSPSNVEQALELLERAITLSPNNPEILDSWGFVLMVGVRPKEAINKYEMAIRQDGKRLDTRKRLREAYEAVGLNDMVAAQNRIIQSMELANVQSSTIP